MAFVSEAQLQQLGVKRAKETSVRINDHLGLAFDKQDPPLVRRPVSPCRSMQSQARTIPALFSPTAARNGMLL